LIEKKKKFILENEAALYIVPGPVGDVASHETLTFQTDLKGSRNHGVSQ